MQTLHLHIHVSFQKKACMIELLAPSEGNSDTVKSMNTCLDEADIFRVLSEALAAHVESVFTDQTVSI